MKALFILALTFPLLSFGQKFNFKGELVDSIFIKSHLAAYQFDDDGTTKGKESTFLIAFNSDKNQYKIEKYLSKEFVASFKTESVKVKTKDLTSKVKNDLDCENIKLLLNSLSSPLKSKDLINQIDTSEFYSFVTPKQILKSARRYDIAWYFKKRYTTKEKNQLFFNSCISLDSLETYLTENFDTEGYVMVTDFESTFNIWITTTKSEYRFEAKYPNSFKQPWYDHSDTTEVFPETILNFDINKAVSKILPKNFLLIDTISDIALFHSYIRWYFERRRMLI